MKREIRLVISREEVEAMAVGTAVSEYGPAPKGYFWKPTFWSWGEVEVALAPEEVEKPAEQPAPKPDEVTP